MDLDLDKPNFELYGSEFKPLLEYLHAGWLSQLSDIHFVAGAMPGLRMARSYRDLESVASVSEASDILSKPVNQQFFEQVWAGLLRLGKLPSGAVPGATYLRFTLDFGRFWRARISLLPYSFGMGNKSTGNQFILESRILPHTPFSWEDLPYPQSFFEQITQSPTGIILVGGLAGSGRSSTIASLLIHCASHFQGMSVATLESPVEFVIQPYSLGRSRAVQTEVPMTQDAWAQALEVFSGLDVNLAVLSEVYPFLPTGKTLSLADSVMAMASNGRLVLSAIQGTSFYDVWHRFTFRPNASECRLAQELAIHQLNAILVQQIVTRVDGNIVLPELHCGCMVFTPDFRSQILKHLVAGDNRAIRDAFVRLETDDTQHGNMSFLTSLNRLVGCGIIPSTLNLGSVRM